jgi:hypothetical protein
MIKNISRKKRGVTTTCDFKEYAPFGKGELLPPELRERMDLTTWDWDTLRYFQSSVYRVSFYVQPPVEDVRPFHFGLLSYRRRDGKTIGSWREKQLIKDCIAGTLCEGAELFPSHLRLLDTANQYHLWLMPSASLMPFGYFQLRCTDQDEEVAKMGSLVTKNRCPQQPRKSRHDYTEDAGFGPYGLLGKWWEEYGYPTTDWDKKIGAK